MINRHTKNCADYRLQIDSSDKQFVVKFKDKIMDKLRQTEKSLTKEKNQTMRQNDGLSSGKTHQTDEQRDVNKTVRPANLMSR